MKPIAIVKTSEVGDEFKDLIGKEITFASDIITIGGKLLHSKNEKAIISDIEYRPAYWSRLCPDIWREAQINTIYINDTFYQSYLPDTFLEFKNK